MTTIATRRVNQLKQSYSLAVLLMTRRLRRDGVPRLALVSRLALPLVTWLTLPLVVTDVSRLAKADQTPSCSSLVTRLASFVWSSLWRVAWRNYGQNVIFWPIFMTTTTLKNVIFTGKSQCRRSASFLAAIVNRPLKNVLRFCHDDGHCFHGHGGSF